MITRFFFFIRTPKFQSRLDVLIFLKIENFFENVLIDVLDRNSNKKQKKSHLTRAYCSLRPEKKSFKLNLWNLKQKASLDQLFHLNRHIQEAAFHVWTIKLCLIFLISGWHCSYDVLKFWPNLSLNVLINEVLIKKTTCICKKVWLYVY